MEQKSTDARGEAVFDGCGSYDKKRNQRQKQGCARARVSNAGVCEQESINERKKQKQNEAMIEKCARREWVG